MTIVFLNMSRLEHWKQGAVNRNFHIVRKIIARKDVENVVIVDQIPHSAWQATKHIGKEIIKGKRVSGPKKTSRLRVGDKYIWHISTSSLSLIRRQIQHIRKGEGQMVLWSFNPFFMPLVRSINHTHFVFDAVDNWVEHHSYRNQKKRLLSLYKEIDKTADCIFTVSKNAEHLFKTNPNVHWIPNGVDCDHFKPSPPHEKLANIPHPIVGYHGIIEHRIDFDLAARVAKAMPNISFVFVGPIWRTSDRTPVEGLKNVYFPGPIPYQEVPKAVQAFDVGWIPHRVNQFTESMNPLKMVEYAAMQKPIISTPVAGTGAFDPWVKIVNDSDSAVLELTEALKTGPIPEMRERAKNRSWEKIADTMYRTAWDCIHKKEREEIKEEGEEKSENWEWPVQT